MPLLGYENYKPLNLKWQRNFSTILSFQKKWNSDETRNIYFGTESVSEIDTWESLTRLYSRYGWGYFPSNRTAINAFIQMNTSFAKFSTAMTYKQMRIISPEIDFSADYFLSYRTRLTAHWNLNYKSSRAVTNTNETVNSHELSSGISFGLTHSIL
jgi:hypothetical protein